MESLVKLELKDDNLLSDSTMKEGSTRVHCGDHLSFATALSNIRLHPQVSMPDPSVNALERAHVDNY